MDTEYESLLAVFCIAAFSISNNIFQNENKWDNIIIQ